MTPAERHKALEDLRYEDRKRLLRRTQAISGGRRIIVKLHPYENAVAPQVHTLRDGNMHEMVANYDVLITQHSSVTFTALALSKEDPFIYACSGGGTCLVQTNAIPMLIGVSSQSRRLEAL